MLEEHRHLLIAKRAAIVEDLLVEDVFGALRSRIVIDQEDGELISGEKTSRKRAEKLLDLLPNKGYEAFGHFYESLREKYGHLAQLLVEGIGGNQVTSVVSEVAFMNNDASGGSMTSSHRKLLIANRVYIVDDLLVDDVLDELVSKLVFDYDDVELIHAESTSKRQAEKLLDLLVTKGDKAFRHFLDALKDPSPHIVELLETDNQANRRKTSFVADELDIVESKLSEGGVPQRPVVYTNRPQELKLVRADLCSLTERDAWVIMHGMAGSGKTVLAAEALREASLLDDSFPGGIFWLEVGPVNRPKLLMKMQNLCSRLDEDKMRPLPGNLEAARDRLKSIFTHQHPRTLLVLDDLWSAHDARFFDIRARVLVTTCDVSIADRVEGTKYRVHVAEKMSNPQCLDVLSKWTKKPVIELSNEAGGIIRECNGHPLTISMIGAMLREHPLRWCYYLSQLRNHKLSKLKAKFAYQYSLSEAIALGIENLSEDLKEKYRDFVLFEASVKVPVSVFCLLWDMEQEEVEDVMDDLVNKSLVKGVGTSHVPHEHASYAVHNLQLNYLLENCKDIEARHQRLVMCYQKACKGKFASLPDDGYVFWNLIHHMLEAKLQGNAIALLTDLAWVTKKLEVAGPADMINDYIKVKKSIEEEEEKDEVKNLEDFHQFLRTNAHVFVSRPVPDVVVQAALSEPANSDVYTQAKAEAIKRSKEGKLFVDWCNKQKETSYSLEMTVKPHNGAIHCCAFSSDGKTVVSSSSDGTAKVWEAVSGKVLYSLEGHDNIVSCCAFNNDNTKVLTASYDKTVKIWDIGLPGDNLKLICKDHTQDVYCAAFSPKASGPETVISCSDNIVEVWDCETGSTSVTCKGHCDVVRWCCFSPDGERIASGSHDQTIKIWKVDTGDCLATSPKHDTFVSYCCFSRDGNLVYASSVNFIRIWDSSTCDPRGYLDITSPVLAFVLSPLGDKLAAASSDASIHLWDINTKEALNAYHGHKSWVHTVDFSPDGTQLVSGSADETVKVWPVDTTAFAKRPKLKRVFDVFFGPDKLTIAVADNRFKLKIFEGPHVAEVSESEPQSSKLTCCVFSQDGNSVAVGLKLGEVQVLSVQTCQPLVKFEGHEALVYSLAFNRTGSVLLSCSLDKSFMTWNTETGQALLAKESRHSDAVTLGFFFDDDQRIATSSKDGTAKVWDSTSGQLLFTCDHHSNEWVLTCAVSANNEKLVTGSVDNDVKVWDAKTGKHLFKISPHGDCIRSLSICERNGVFVTGSDDGTVVISSLDDGHCIACCTSHEAWVSDMAFGKNCSQLVTVSNNIQWHKVNGTLLQQFSLRGSYPRHIKSSRDFSTFVTVDNIGVLYILKLIS